MKTVLFLLFSLFFCYDVVMAQTFANAPGPENVLVVYKIPSSPQDILGLISDSVKEYYITARGIPGTNVVGLDGLIDIK